jgi:hypothetical protein
MPQQGTWQQAWQQRHLSKQRDIRYRPCVPITRCKNGDIHMPHAIYAKE